MKRVVAVSVLAFLLFAAMRSNDATPLATPETYRCSAVVYDATDEHRVFASPEVIVAAGERQSKTVVVEGLEVTFTVAMSRGNDRAATEVVGKRGEKIVLRQKSDVALRAPKQAIVPLW